MEETQYLPEEELVEKVQSGEYGWLEYINHHSPEWQEEFSEYYQEHGLTADEDTAKQFVDYKDRLMEDSMDN
jgi:lantibiotic modifying enzyme